MSTTTATTIASKTRKTTTATTSTTTAGTTAPSAPPRPSSAASRKAIASVDSLEHATSIIRSMRSLSHSQKCYHRTACADVNIISSLQQFDDLVAKRAADVSEAKRINVMINKSLSSSKPQQRALATLSSSQTAAVHDLSSDEEDNNMAFSTHANSKQHKKRAGNMTTTTTTTTFSHHSEEPSRHSVEEEPRSCSRQHRSPARTASTRPHPHTRGVPSDSDDDLLGGLDSDDEQDMADLMKGFVGPTITSPGSSNRRKQKSSAIHDLEDSCDSPSYLTEQKDNVQRTRSAGSAMVGDSATLGTWSSSAASRKHKSKSAKHKSETDRSTASSVVSASSTASSTASFAAASSTGATTATNAKKHNVMITPGQRIRVRPSRKNK